jgi:hypothetical protein
MKPRHYISVSERAYELLVREAKKKHTTITKVVLELTGDIVGIDQIESARRRYRRYS